jgi:NAD(P)-dependent dehydrogenase (short-subunit alcohol dehydrogenase family)
LKILPRSADSSIGVNRVNVRGIWTFMKHELLQMKKQRGGAVVNCSSLGGLVGLPGRAAYHASKHGVMRNRVKDKYLSVQIER